MLASSTRRCCARNTARRKLSQYQKVVSNDDITHCSHGLPCGPNCGGLYPSASAVGTTCSCTYGELHVLLMETMRLAKRHRNLTLAFYERRDFASQPPRIVERVYYRRAGMSRRIQAEIAACVHMCQHSERTVATRVVCTSNPYFGDILIQILLDLRMRNISHSCKAEYVLSFSSFPRQLVLSSIWLGQRSW